MSKAAEVMMNKASDCLELARAESDSAITQHENAERLRAAADQQNATYIPDPRMSGDIDRGRAANLHHGSSNAQ
jgi:hypothetical protein